MKYYDMEFTFLEPLIGTVPMDKEIYTSFVASKAPVKEVPEDELDSVVESLEKQMTGFHEVDGKPVLYNYVIKGFFKDACGMLRRTESNYGDEGKLSRKLPAYKQVIDGLLFVWPRQIEIVDGEKSIIERPLRANTPKGPRVALAKSEMMSAGSRIKFRLGIMGKVNEDLLKEWLWYGSLRGLGQWRNAGYGAFGYTRTQVKEEQ